LGGKLQTSRETAPSLPINDHRNKLDAWTKLKAEIEIVEQQAKGIVKTTVSYAGTDIYDLQPAVQVVEQSHLVRTIYCQDEILPAAIEGGRNRRAPRLRCTWPYDELGDAGRDSCFEIRISGSH
jgi:hypothetical protein